MKVKVVTIGLLLLLGCTPLAVSVSANETIECSYQNDGWEYVGDVNAYYLENGTWYYRTVGLYVKIIKQVTFYQIKVDDEIYAVVNNDNKKYTNYSEYQYRAGDYYFKNIR